MSELTKEYFDKSLKGIKGEIISLEKSLGGKIGSLDKSLRGEMVAIEKRIGLKMEEEISSLARMTSNCFDELERQLDVRQEVEELKKQMQKVMQALSL